MDNHLFDVQPEQSYKKNAVLRVAFFLFGAVVVIVIVGAMLVWQNNKAPGDFPAAGIFRIENGATVRSVANALTASGYVKSKTLFQFFVLLLDARGRVVAGDYLFTDPLSAYDLAVRITHGDRELGAYKITIPEGYTAKEISGLFSAKYPKLNNSTLVASLTTKEGYLFPETYFLSPIVTETEIVRALTDMFNERTKSLASAFAQSSHTKSENIIMASIIEGEARTDAERPVVAGILWKRLGKGMPLQVDATFAYTLGKSSDELTISDLRKDGPYNTYTRKGLPPTPIDNPGLPSIKAALEPQASDYWYYLHDARGIIHYARTYEEHLKNKKLYLK